MTSGSSSRARGHDRSAAPIMLALARAQAAAGLAVEDSILAQDTTARQAIDLATSLGAPLAPVLDGIVEMTRARARLAAEVRGASAEGRAVAVGLVVGPPALGLATAALVTDDPVRVLASPAGRILLVAAGSLWLVGILLVVGAIRRAGRPPPAEDDVFVLTATALRAGEPLSAALRRAAVAAGPGPRGRRSLGSGTERADPRSLALWLDLGATGEPPAGWGHTGRSLAAAHAAGVAMAPLLDQLGVERRVAAHDDALERAARLGATLAIPTALFLLPAGLLLAAGPLLLAALEELV